MKKSFIATACGLAIAFYVTPVAADYTSDYNCAMEAFAADAAGAVSYCIGNAYDPSPETLKAYADAEQDFKTGSTGQASQCPFEFGVWLANGSRSDGFEEGARPINTLQEAAGVLDSGRNVFLYDNQGDRIPANIANQWFVRQGEDVVLTSEARKSCSDKIS